MVGKRVLVVDDDKLICWALEKEIAGLRLAPHAVETGADALSELSTQPYDLLFLDIHLPDSDGNALLPEIERISPDTKVIVMSCDACEGNRRRALAGGALQFLEKPFDLSDFRRILKSATGEYSRIRIHPRHLCRLPVQFSVIALAPGESLSDSQDILGTAVDIGLGGVRLWTEYPLQAGQRLVVRIPAGNDPFLQDMPQRAAAEVVWAVPDEPGITAGLKFPA